MRCTRACWALPTSADLQNLSLHTSFSGLYVAPRKVTRSVLRYLWNNYHTSAALLHVFMTGIIILAKFILVRWVQGEALLCWLSNYSSLTITTTAGLSVPRYNKSSLDNNLRIYCSCYHYPKKATPVGVPHVMSNFFTEYFDRWLKHSSKVVFLKV